MSLIFSFPTLKQLSMLCIGQNLVSEKAGVFCSLFSKSSKEIRRLKLNANQYILPIESFVYNLQIPSTLKPELCDVLAGIYQQVFNWLFVFARNTDYQEYKDIPLVFDVHGYLDYPSIWLRYYERKVADLENIRSLYELLYRPNTHLFLEIGIILDRILVVAEGDEASSLLDGPHYNIVQNHLTLFYKFVGSQGEKLGYKTFRVLNSMKFFTMGIAFDVSKKGITVTFNDPSKYHPQAIVEYYNLLDPSRKKLYVIRSARKYALGHEDGSILHLIRLLNYDAQVGCFSYRDSFHILVRFLEWPLAKNFIPLLKLARQILRPGHFFYFFGVIILKMPPKSKLGVFYGDLLIQFCKVIPDNLKKSFRDSIHNPNTRIFFSMLDLQRVNNFVHSTVLNILCK